MKALWIADAHLSDPRSDSYRLLVRLLQESLEHVDCLVILGDLFQLWVGDNRLLVERHAPMLQVLRTFRDRGKEMHYLKGNHDFLLGATIRDDIGARVHDEEAVFRWEGRSIYASHGENINKKDWGYRFLRMLLRASWTEKAVERIDDGLVVRVASRLEHAAKGAPLQEEQAGRRDRLKRLFSHYARERIAAGHDAVVLAHTHLIQWEPIASPRGEGLFVNPGSWMDDRTWLLYEDTSFRLFRYGIDGPDPLHAFRFAPASGKLRPNEETRGGEKTWEA